MAQMTRVAVLGALGMMGKETVLAVSADTELELTAAVDVAVSGEARSQVSPVSGIPVLASIELLDPDETDVIVDFTNAIAAARDIRWAMENGVHAVVGTTGIAEDEMEILRSLAEVSKGNVLMAPNFAIGAVLMMKFAQMAAGVFDQCEIIELHHRGKKDSPSGTALATAARVAAAMEASALPEYQENEVAGARGGLLGPVSLHSVRLDGLVAHQEVIFGSQGQTLIIRHDTTDRSCFMPGVILAIKAVADLPGFTVGLEPLLGI